MSMATSATPDNATQILVARLDTGGHSFLACSWVPGGCRGPCQVDAGLDELEVSEAAGGRVIAGLRRRPPDGARTIRIVKRAIRS
jgi:hypothetical protein